VTHFLACLVLLGTTSVATAQDFDRHHQDKHHHHNPPDVPDEIAVPEGNKPFLIGHAIGTQNYVCVPSGASVAWSLFTPQATLFDDHGNQLTTHFFSPNPFENPAAVRATWQDSRDTSSFWGAVVRPSTDPNFVEQGAIPWLLIAPPGPNTEPTGHGRLIGTTFVQRVNTAGGVAPATGCATSTDVGKRVFVPYAADYVFWRSQPPDGK
jgi:hypothetical protein